MRARLLVPALLLAPALLACSEEPAPVATPTPVFTTGAPVSLDPVDGCSVVTPPPPLPTIIPSRPAMAVENDETYYATVDTNCGDIVWRMRVKDAPETVNSFVALAKAHYYDGSYCHRQTKSASLSVLQCGDTGTGGARYGLPEENLPDGGFTGLASYPRGTVAMARTSQPGSGNAQFFLVYADSQLPPDYTVAGQIVKGLDVLDKVTSFGIEGGSTDGAPVRRIFIEEFTVSTTPPK